MNSLAILALVASLYHTLNHAVFKALLFLGAGSVISSTHTRNMEEYGGLVKRMPMTAGFFLVGSMAISALPPFNGFFSEWMTFQSLFQGVLGLDLVSKIFFLLAIFALALTGGLAAACFVKAFGITFLARERSEEAFHSKEIGNPSLFGMGILAFLTVIFGMSFSQISGILAKVSGGLSAFGNSAPAFSSLGASLNIGDKFSSLSAPFIFLSLLLSIVLVYIFSLTVYRDQKISIGRTWDCGADLTPRMVLTATAFSRSIIIVFNRLFNSTRTIVKVTGSFGDNFPKSRMVLYDFFDVYKNYLYEPIAKFITKISGHIKNIQSGDVNEYVLYLFLALITLLIFTTF